jgi:putative PIG3 family NAD(P)H quinone oxidoreductase
VHVKAIVVTEPGGPEKLALRDVPAPEPQRGEVRVRVRATAVNRADLLQRMGLYPAPPGSPADIPGLEIAGEVEVLGDGVRELAVGDRVFGVVGGGGYAERVVAHARTLARMPDGLSFTDAAAVPEAFITAWDALFEQARLGPGERVLVHAAGSGVGTAAVQIARALGARCIGTARTADKLERARALGMHDGVLVEKGRFADAVCERTGGAGVDVVLELVGGAYVAEDLGCIAERGRIVLVGLLAGMRAPELDLGVLLRKRVSLVGTVLRARPLEEKIAATRSFARHVVPLIASGALCPVVEAVLPLERAAEAHERMAKGDLFGKLVLEVS